MLTIKQQDLRVRERNGKFKVISVVQYSNLTCTRSVLCTFDTFEKAMEKLQKITKVNSKDTWEDLDKTKEVIENIIQEGKKDGNSK